MFVIVLRLSFDLVKRHRKVRIPNQEGLSMVAPDCYHDKIQPRHKVTLNVDYPLQPQLLKSVSGSGLPRWQDQLMNHKDPPNEVLVCQRSVYPGEKGWLTLARN